MARVVETPIYWTIRDVAEAAQWGLSTMFRRLAAGDVGPMPVRCGRSTRFLREEVLEWLEQGAEGGRLLNRTEWQARRREQSVN
jgi:predicted DNA-binding transcriptional regulator AlpA